MSRLHTALAYSWGWAARVVLLASWVLALSGETRAAVILTDIDARVSTGAYSVTVASGAAPLVRLNYSEHTQYAQFFLDSLAFDEPFSLAGRIGGDEWNMEFTLTGQTDDPAARFLTLGFTGQHLVANYPSQPPTGPPLSGGGFLSTGTGVYLGRFPGGSPLTGEGRRPVRECPCRSSGVLGERLSFTMVIASEPTKFLPSDRRLVTWSR